MEENTLLSQLDGLDIRFEEVATLITDPSVISDQKRYVKLTKKYHDLETLLSATRDYKSLLSAIAEAKQLISSEEDAELKAMAMRNLRRQRRGCLKLS